MEFFSGIQHPHLDIPALKNLLTIENLPGLCASISSATPDSDNAGNIYCLWGKAQPDPEFAESIEMFVSDWSDGMRNALARQAGPA